MDPTELARMALPIFAAGFIAAVITVVFGTRHATKTNAAVQRAISETNRLTAVEVAEVNAESARVVAREKDLRDWRREQMRPVLERINTRVALWREFSEAPGATDIDRVRDVYKRLKETDPLTSNQAAFAIPDAVFRRCFLGLLNADKACRRTLLQHGTSGDRLPVVNSSASATVVAKLASATWLVHSAVERYIYTATDEHPLGMIELAEGDEGGSTPVIA